MAQLREGTPTRERAHDTYCINCISIMEPCRDEDCPVEWHHESTELCANCKREEEIAYDDISE